MYLCTTMKRKLTSHIRLAILVMITLLVVNPVASAMCVFEGARQSVQTPTHSSAHLSHSDSGHNNHHHSSQHPTSSDHSEPSHSHQSDSHQMDCCDEQDSPFGCSMADALQGLTQLKIIDLDWSQAELPVFGFIHTLLFSEVASSAKHTSSEEPSLLIFSQTIIHKKSSFLI